LAVIVAVVVMATGCDKVLGINAFPDASSDSSDAGPIACADRHPKPPLCADFDEDPPLAYVSEVPTVWSLAGTGVTAEVRHPGHTGTGALWLTDTGGTYTQSFDPHLNATVVKVVFDLDVDQQSAAPVEAALAKIDFEGSGHNSCYALVTIDESVPTLRVTGACGSPDPHGEIPIPFGWVHVVFTFDISGDNVATLKVNDTTATATFFSGALANLNYSVQLGPDAPGLTGLVVAYDSIEVTSKMIP